MEIESSSEVSQVQITCNVQVMQAKLMLWTTITSADYAMLLTLMAVQMHGSLLDLPDSAARISDMPLHSCL